MSAFLSPSALFYLQVTLIKNLEVYGLDPAVVATTLQHRVQASTVLQPIPGSKDKVSVQIQGNQIHQAGNLLLGSNLIKVTSTPNNNASNLSEPFISILDHYKIPRKYIQGLEKASNKGGKKK